MSRKLRPMFQVRLYSSRRYREEADMNSNLAKIFGWGQFGLQVVGTAVQQGLPHGLFGWLGLVTSLLTAVGVHAASATDGVK